MPSHPAHRGARAVLLSLGLAAAALLTGTAAHAAPAAPQGVWASATSSSSITIGWQPVLGQSVTRYKVEDQATKESREIFGENTSSYQWSGLTSGQTYCYVVRALTLTSTTGGVSSLPSAQVCTAPVPAAPAAPQGVTVQADSTTSLIISWQPVYGQSVTRYKVEDQATKESREIFGESAGSYRWTGLNTGSSYCYVVRALTLTSTSGGVSSLPSQQVCGIPSQPPPSAPQGVTASADSTSAITIRWQPVFGQSVTRYKVEDQATKESRELFGESAGAYQWTGLTSGKQYCFVVRALTLTSTTGGVSSLPSQQTCATTTQIPPDAPQGVTATGTSTSGITIRWQPVLGQNVTRYKVEDQETKVSREIFGESAASYQWTGLTSGRQYCYLVRALTLTSTTGGVSSLPSAQVCASTAQQAPAAPFGVTATPASSTSITIRWQAVSGQSVTRYKVEDLATREQREVFGEAASSYVWDGLTPGDGHCYVVRALTLTSTTGGISSLPSQQACAAAMPGTPSGVTATVAGATSVTVSWNAVDSATRYKVTNETSGVQTPDLTSGTSYAWTNLTSGTNYCFTVIACAAVGSCSAPSARACASPSAGGTALALEPAAVPLNASSGLAGQTTFVWSVVARNAVQVVVEIRNPLRGSTTPFVMTPSGSGDTYTYQQALSSVTGYSYRFRATSESGAVAVLPNDGSFSAGPDVQNPQGCAAPGSFTLAQPFNGSSASANVTLRWNASAGAAEYDVYLWKTTGGVETRVASVSSTEYAAELAPSTGYLWKVRARAECQATVESTSGTWRFTTSSSTAPPAGMPRFVDPPSVTPDQGTREATEFVWRATLENAVRAYVSIRNPLSGELHDFPMTKAIATLNGGTFEFRKTLVSAGNYQFRVTAFSTSGLARVYEPAPSELLPGPLVFEPGSDAVAVTIDASPLRPLEGQLVQFTPHVNAAGLQYTWNFGDETVSNEPNPSHAYAAAGTYNVTLTVSKPASSSGAYQEHSIGTAATGSATQSIQVQASGSSYPVRGVLQWENGQAIGGADVLCTLPVQQPGTSPVLFDRVTTNDSGVFTIQVPKSGDFTLQAKFGGKSYGSQLHRADVQQTLGKSLLYTPEPPLLTVPLPVVFIHGFGYHVFGMGTPAKWDAWEPRFAARGGPTLRVDYSGRTNDAHEVIARDVAIRQIEEFLNGLGLKWKPKIQIVAHSKGGLVTRALFFKWPDAVARIRKVATLGTPNNGSKTADTLGLDYLETDYMMRTFNRDFPGYFINCSGPFCHDERRLLAVAGVNDCDDGQKTDGYVDAVSATTIEIKRDNGTEQSTLPRRGVLLSHSALAGSTDGENGTLLERVTQFFKTSTTESANDPSFTPSCEQNVGSSWLLESDAGDGELSIADFELVSSTAAQSRAFDFEGGLLRLALDSDPNASIRLWDPSGVERTSALQLTDPELRLYEHPSAPAGHWTVAVSGALTGGSLDVSSGNAIVFDKGPEFFDGANPATTLAGSIGSADSAYRISALSGTLVDPDSGALLSQLRAFDTGTGGDTWSGDGIFEVQVDAPSTPGTYFAHLLASLTATGGGRTQRTLTRPITVRSPRVSIAQAGVPTFADQDGDGLADSVAIEVSAVKLADTAASVRARLETSNGTVIANSTATIADAESSALLVFPFSDASCTTLTALAVAGLQIYDDGAGGVPSTGAEMRVNVPAVPSAIACGRGELAARFRLSTATPRANETLAFSNDSLGAVASTVWDFGDGTGSSDRDTAHVYSAAGQYTVRLAVSDGAGRSDFTTETLTVAPAAPVGVPPAFVATATSPSTVTLSWNGTPGAHHYEVVRRQPDGTYPVAGTSASPSLTLTGLTPDTAYLYAVRAVDGAGTASALSTVDVATTTLFTDDPLEPGITPVKAQHLAELRNAVASLRAAAGLPAVTLTADPLIRAAHILELRAALDVARAAAGLPRIAYTTSVTAGGTIRAADVTELRDGVQ
jgi:PKD repeat protein